MKLEFYGKNKWLHVSSVFELKSHFWNPNPFLIWFQLYEVWVKNFLMKKLFFQNLLLGSSPSQSLNIMSWLYSVSVTTRTRRKNNPNIQDLSELVVLNLVKRLNSKRKIKLCWLRKMIFNLNFMVSCFFLFCFKYRKYNFFCDKNTLLWISMGSVFFGKYVFYPKFYFNLIISSYFISL